MTDTEPTTPTTESGKRLAQVTSYQEQPEMVGAILAIEAEAEAAATEKARADALEQENARLRLLVGRLEGWFASDVAARLNPEGVLLARLESVFHHEPGGGNCAEMPAHWHRSHEVDWASPDLQNVSLALGALEGTLEDVAASSEAWLHAHDAQVAQAERARLVAALGPEYLPYGPGRAPRCPECEYWPYHETEHHRPDCGRGRVFALLSPTTTESEAEA